MNEQLRAAWAKACADMTNRYRWHWYLRHGVIPDFELPPGKEAS